MPMKRRGELRFQFLLLLPNKRVRRSLTNERTDAKIKRISGAMHQAGEGVSKKQKRGFFCSNQEEVEEHRKLKEVGIRRLDLMCQVEEEKKRLLIVSGGKMRGGPRGEGCFCRWMHLFRLRIFFGAATSSRCVLHERQNTRLLFPFSELFDAATRGVVPTYVVQGEKPRKDAKTFSPLPVMVLLSSPPWSCSDGQGRKGRGGEH